MKKIAIITTHPIQYQIPLFKYSEVGLGYGNFWYIFEKKNRKKIFKKKKLPTGIILNELINYKTIGEGASVTSRQYAIDAWEKPLYHYEKINFEGIYRNMTCIKLMYPNVSTWCIHESHSSS